MTILALAGKAGAGKDSFAEVLVKKHGFTRVALADPLRELCAKVFKIPYNDFLDQDKKDLEFEYGRVMLDYHHIDQIRQHLEEEWGQEISYEARENMEEYYGAEFETPRDILRCVGTSLIRHNVRDDLWIELAFNKIRQIGQKVVITDCRFQNERDTFERAGATLVLIKRNDDGNTKEHEFDLGKDDDYDVIFENNENLTTFQSSVDMWYTLRRDELEKHKVFKYV